MTVRQWSLSMGYFTPSGRSPDDWLYHTELSNSDFIDSIIADHMRRSPQPRTVANDYQADDYSDEFRINVRSGKRWRCLVNMQLEWCDS